MAKRTRWADLSRFERGALLALVAIEFALTSAAAVDLSFRARRDVRGGKLLWWLAIFIQPIGPIAYLLLGRHRIRPENADAPATAGRKGLLGIGRRRRARP